MDRFDCYELCVQGVRWVVPFLRGLHAHNPRVLREDFCGTAALSREWTADLRGGGLEASAVGVDLDARILARAAAAGTESSIRLVHADAVRIPVVPADACDVIFVGNFSIGYIHTRSLLVDYLRRSAARLSMAPAAPGSGLMVCDLYDSPGKFARGMLHRTHPGPGNQIVHYTWEQREADALTAMVTAALHFRVVADGEVIAELPDAFVYRWRLWSIPELREAMLEAGFASTEVHQHIDEKPVPLSHGRELGESGIVCVAGRL